jgi:hypothetical protein
MNHLFEIKGKRYKHKMRIVLSTPNGKYTIRRYIKYWNPVTVFFRNYFTAIVYPSTLKYKDKFVGSNIKYIVCLDFNGNEQTILLRAEDYQIKIFRNFNLTKESLESKAKLEQYLNELLEKGILNCNSIKVLDSSDWKDESRPSFAAEELSSFEYYILGKVATWKSNTEMQRKNKKAKKQHELKMSSPKSKKLRKGR